MPPSGLDDLEERRERRTRSSQRLEPKRTKPERRGDDAPEAYTRFTVPVDTVAFNPANPRQSYDEAALDEMVVSFHEFGQLQPIAIISRGVWLRHRPTDEDAIGQAEYVTNYGHRRLAARIKGGWNDIDATLKDDLGSGEVDRFDEIMLVENIHRQDIDPLMEAKALQALLDKPGASYRSVAQAIGVSHGYVQQRVGLLSLIPELRGALQEGALGLREARKISPLAPDKQRESWRAGPPFEPPEPLVGPDADSTTNEETAETDGAVHQVYNGKPKPKRFSVPAGDPSKVAEVLRKRLTAEELAEIRRLLAEESE